MNTFEPWAMSHPRHRLSFVGIDRTAYCTVCVTPAQCGPADKSKTMRIGKGSQILQPYRVTQALRLRFAVDTAVLHWRRQVIGINVLTGHFILVRLVLLTPFLCCSCSHIHSTLLH